MDKAKFVNQVSVRKTRTEELKKSQFYGVALRRLKGKSEFINNWLELQDAVNCFIDPSRSSRMADREFKGVRQIL